MLHVVTASVNAVAGTDAVVTTNDGSVTLTRDAAGDYTLTFGDAFLSTPTVIAQTVDATFATTAAHVATVLSSATNTAHINIITVTTNGTATDILSALADINFSVIAVGLRNN
jgi:hypothetical protein